MTRTPLVTCIIPSYNYAHFVTHAIESALAQDYPSEALEIIVVDDGSQDNTFEVLQPYMDRITYIRKENGGVVSAVNRGLAEARGEFITILSADDLWPADRVRPDVEYLLDHPNVGLIYGDMEIINDQGQTRHQSFRELYKRPAYRGRLFGLLLKHCYISGGIMMFRGSLKELVYPIPENMPSEDWWIALRVAEVSEIEATDRIVARYRYHGQNMNLGSQGAKLANLMRIEVPLRRHFLSGVAVGQATLKEVLEAYFALENSAIEVAKVLDCSLCSVVEVTLQDQELATECCARGVRALERDAAEEAMFHFVNALALDPWNQQGRMLLQSCLLEAGIGAPRILTGHNPFCFVPSDPDAELHWRIREQLNTTDWVGQLRQHEWQTRMERVGKRQPQRLIARPACQETLHVVYVMAHVGVTGGSKVIFQHANHLSHLGVKVTIVSHFPKPDWYPILCDYLQIPFQIELAEGIPECDVIVATYWDHIQACVEMGVAPVVYFEQGDFHLYDHVEPHLASIVTKQIQSAAFVITVSYQAAAQILARYGRESMVFHNAIDSQVFNRSPRQASHEKPYLMMMGSDRLAFKGTATVLEAYNLVKERGYDLDLVWVSPQELASPTGYVFIRPEQQALGDLYRGATVFVSGSEYESFALPPLEAMACGCPVVSTAHAGILEYAKDGQNCLLAGIGDAESIASLIISLLEDSVLRQRLILGGYETANQFDWACTAANLASFYRYVGGLEPVPQVSVDDWEVTVSPDRFLGHEEYESFRRALQHSLVDIILAPAVDEVFTDHFLARWEVVARKRGVKGERVLRLFAPMRGHETPLPYEAALELFRAGQFRQALERFNEGCARADQFQEKMVYIRWIVQCMIELEQDSDAIQLLQKALKDSPYNTDLLYLYGNLLKLSGMSDGIDEVRTRIELVGESAFLPEFFFGIREIAAARLR